MKITSQREPLLKAFLDAGSVAPTRSPKPVLQNVRFDVDESGAQLTATDLEVSARLSVKGVEVESPGSVLLPIDRFGSILRESTEEQLSLETDGQQIVVRGARSEFKFPAQNPDEFPQVAALAEGSYYELPARLLREMIRRTIFATDPESSRYALGGVLFEFDQESLIAVATDGRRLATMLGPCHASGASAETETAIVPARCMQLLARTLTDGDAEIQIAVRGNDIQVKSPRAVINSRLVEGRFPKWRDVMPDEKTGEGIEINVGPFYSAVQQAKIVTSEETRGVDFAFGEGSLVLSAQSAEFGQSRVELPLAYDGAPITITLDPNFVADFLKVLDPQKSFQFQLQDGESAAVCRTDDGYGYVIMPLARG